MAIFGNYTDLKMVVVKSHPSGYDWAVLGDHGFNNFPDMLSSGWRGSKEDAIQEAERTMSKLWGLLSAGQYVKWAVSGRVYDTLED